ncbi:Hsp20/alpha crystallin family protein [Bacillus massilinigeriensis]|uniref:Hsp20/alpha crystallin family protein n=1 Tax=Bacillus massilionigeriensis TaxID=1805475 RepID=UPI00096B059E|nr:Hsp20/alpha crystallin family protein [Bacillus massilionigeriensis]
MSSNLPGNSNYPESSKKNNDHEPFGDLMKTMNGFFLEKPVKGFLQSIDEFFKTPFPFQGFAVDLIEKENEYIVQAELPGVKREQIHIDVYSNYVTISVNSQDIIIEENEKNSYYSKQKTIQKASRTISLPHHINEKQVKATYQNGLLLIRIPKQKGKRIPIGDE